MIRKVNVEVTEIGAVTVKFEGGHLSKRELLRVIKSIKIERNRYIREYRKELIKNKHVVKDVKEENNGTGKETRREEPGREETSRESSSARTPDEVKSSNGNVGEGEGKVVTRVKGS